MNRKQHWENIYTTKASSEVSWYQPAPHRSIELLVESGATADSTIIDIGGGDSTLVDALVEQGLGRVTVLDLSGAALQRARERLGQRAAEVIWLEADITHAELSPTAFDAWHDRAAFHFLTNARQRRQYVSAAARAVRPGGALIIATFAPDGPTRCSGLEVVRYSAIDLAHEFGPQFDLVRAFVDNHRTPGGAEQRFTYALLRRT
jgi:ubiquinone/menaquinone biosynthesis C-methylase UbiE